MNLLVVAVLAAAGGTGYVRLRHHVTEGQAFCSSCHANVASHLRSPVHADLPCAACHVADAESGLRMYLTHTLTGSKPTTPHGQVVPERCTECHAGESQDRELFAQLGGHASHVLRAGKACSECHGDKTHVESVRESSCSTCHDQVKIFPSPLDGATCTECHAFAGRGRAPRSLAAPECARCHHEPTTKLAFAPSEDEPVTAAMVHGEVGACGLCHNPHGEAPSERVGELSCARCHANVARKRATAPDFAEHSDCSTCHAPHGDRAELQDICAGCHTDRTPNAIPDAISSRHAACSDCHRDHRFTVDKSRCTSCHQKQTAKLAAWKSHKAERHQDCLVCHHPHSEASIFDACKTCHARNQGHGHASCSTCHAPHEEAKGPPPCVSCHAPVAQTLQSSPPAKEGGHKSCTDCHAPHAAGGAKSRCAVCHGEQAAAAATAPAEKHRNCTSCHQPHGFPASAAVCTNCHHPGNLGPHQKDCANCHQNHGPAAPPSVNCQGCHQGINPSRGEHSTCTSCHGLHQPNHGGPICSACHGGPAAAVATWPAPKHQDCLSCHDKHEVATPRTCGSCHGAQAATFGRSKHQCTTCHNPHQPAKEWWSGCATCHSANASATASRGPTHSSCQSCHKPHQGGQIASCTSCHTSRAGLHSQRDHAQCSDCHSTHASRMPDRTACVRCHNDMPEHFPQARVCTSCHNFR